jgi:predicted dehydrogenase
MKTIRIGIVGGGLMGREMASAFARWCSFIDLPVKPELVAVADPVASAREWFQKNIPTLETAADSHTEMLAQANLDVVYVAVPHQLHESIYLDVLEAGCDLFAEKPFGIDLAAAKNIQQAGERSGRFVRCSSEFPFMPGAQAAYNYVKSGACGRILEAVSGFHHSSDLDPTKAANWKRKSSSCGEIGVLGDLGMHAFHLPIRLGWKPENIFAQLQHGYQQRPDGNGGMSDCDTWDNALVHSTVQQDGEESFVMRFEMKRLAPGATNTWFFEAVGTEGGVRYSTSRPKTLEVFERGDKQWWKQTDLGFDVPFKTITGGIFEVGFPDVIQQMWAAFLMEREGLLGEAFGCVTPEEAVYAQRLYAAALAAQANQSISHV